MGVGGTSASALASSSSRPNSRTTASIRSRRPSPSWWRWTRLAATSRLASTIGSSSSAPAARRRPRRPPAWPHRRTPPTGGTSPAPPRRAGRSSTDRLPHGALTGGKIDRTVTQHVQRESKRTSSSSRVSNRIQRAASSNASGNPSSRRHNSATAAALFTVNSKPGSTSPTRATTRPPTERAANEATPPRRRHRRRHGKRSDRHLLFAAHLQTATGWWPGSTRPDSQRGSTGPPPRTPRDQVLAVVEHEEHVALRQWATSAAITEAAPSVRTPAAAAIVVGTSAGSATLPRSTNQAPSR